MLPILKAAAEEGKTRSTYYAMLADRVQFRKSGQQKYGSQVFYDKDHNPMPKSLADTKKFKPTSGINGYGANGGLSSGNKTNIDDRGTILTIL